MWQFEYAQCPRGNTWSFKFDHVPLADGRWHPVNRGSEALYRVEHEAIQYCARGTDVPEDLWQAVLADLKTSGPLDTDDEVEMSVTRRDDDYLVSAPWLPDHAGVPAAGLTRPDLTAAYRQLRRLAGQA